MSELTTQLPERLNNTEETGLDAVLSIPLLRLIVEGGPVTVEQFAAAAGRPVDDVRTGLAVVPDTEYDDQGRIIGQGLTLRPTPHRFTVAGEELYTWCALDTLIFPTVLGRPAQVVSPTPGSGELVALSVDPDSGVTALQLIETQSYLQGDTAGPQSVIPPQGIEQAWCR
jgi:alkylmercury lyase